MAWRGRAFLNLLHHVHVHRRALGIALAPEPDARERLAHSAQGCAH